MANTAHPNLATMGRTGPNSNRSDLLYSVNLRLNRLDWKRERTEEQISAIIWGEIFTSVKLPQLPGRVYGFLLKNGKSDIYTLGKQIKAINSECVDALKWLISKGLVFQHEGNAAPVIKKGRGGWKQTLKKQYKVLEADLKKVRPRDKESLYSALGDFDTILKMILKNLLETLSPAKSWFKKLEHKIQSPMSQPFLNLYDSIEELVGGDPVWFSVFRESLTVKND